MVLGSLMLLGRQVLTGHGARIDLLALDEDGWPMSSQFGAAHEHSLMPQTESPDAWTFVAAAGMPALNGDLVHNWPGPLPTRAMRRRFHAAASRTRRSRGRRR